MDLRHQRHCHEFKRAVTGDLAPLCYELYAAGLIPAKVRDRRKADEIVSAIEKRLGSNESAWDTLIKVLRGLDDGATIAHRLTDQLAEVLSEENAPGVRGNIPREQRPNRGGSPACVFK